MLKGKTILVVDDEKDLCDLFADEFEFAGANVIKAYSGNQAFELLLNNQVDLILSDIKMPNGNGVDLLKRVKGSEQHKVITVLMLTGYSDFAMEEVYDYGAEGLLSKPCKMDVLIENIERLLEPRESRFKNPRFRLTSTQDIEISIEGLEEARQAHILNIGSGGMFIAAEEFLPKIGQVISFKIYHRKGEKAGQCCAGIGICRWVRKNGGNETLPSGFGLEFMCFQNEKVLNDFLDFVKAQKPQAYIPKA